MFRKFLLLMFAMFLLFMVMPTAGSANTTELPQYQVIQTGVSVFDFVLCSDIGPIGIINSAQSILLSGKPNVKSYWQIINSIKGNLVLKYPFGEC